MPELLRKFLNAIARAGPGPLPSSPNHRMKVSCVIRAADQRPGGDVEETLFTCDVAVVNELVRSDVFDNRQVFRAGTQILADRQNLAADLAQIVHRLTKFGFFFAETEHHATLGHYFRR